MGGALRLVKPAPKSYLIRSQGLDLGDGGYMENLNMECHQADAQELIANNLYGGSAPNIFTKLSVQSRASVVSLTSA